jgi:hypothetical protein
LKFAARNQEIGTRFTELDLPSVLNGMNLVNANGLAQSRATLEKYRSILIDRGKIEKSTNAEHMAIVNSSGLPPNVAKVLTDEFAKNEAILRPLFIRRDTAQFGTIETTAQLLSFFQKRLGTIDVHNGKLRFETQEQTDFYSSSIARINQYSAEAQAAQTELDSKAALLKQELLQALQSKS